MAPTAEEVVVSPALVAPLAFGPRAVGVKRWCGLHVRKARRALAAGVIS